MTTRRKVRLHLTARGLEASSLILGATVNSDVRALRDLRVAQELLKDFEVALVALLTDSGVSWEAMAEELEVTRQSLHYRLAKQTRQLWNSPPPVSSMQFYERLKVISLNAVQAVDTADGSGESP